MVRGLGEPSKKTGHWRGRGTGMEPAAGYFWFAAGAAWAWCSSPKSAEYPKTGVCCMHLVHNTLPRDLGIPAFAPRSGPPRTYAPGAQMIWMESGMTDSRGVPDDVRDLGGGHHSWRYDV
eukprot:gene17683-biopygen11397